MAKRNISIAAVAAALKEAKSFLDVSVKEIDVRLNFRPDDGGVWHLHMEDASYDTDHRGFWACGYVSSRTNCRQLAKDLLSQIYAAIEDFEACQRLKVHEEELMADQAYDRACTCLPEIESASHKRTCTCGSGLVPTDVGENGPLLLCEKCIGSYC